MSLFKRKDPAGKAVAKGIIGKLVEQVKGLDDEGLEMFLEAMGLNESAATIEEKKTEATENLEVFDENAKPDEAAEISDPEKLDEVISEEKAIESLEDDGVDKEAAHIAVEGSEAVEEEKPGVSTEEPSGEAPIQGESEVISEVPIQDDAIAEAAPIQGEIKDETNRVLLARIEALEAQINIMNEAAAKVKEAEEQSQPYGGLQKKSAISDTAIPRDSTGAPRTKEEWRKMYEPK